MAIAETSRIRTVFGNKTVLFIKGTFASGDTSGTIDTGLVAIDHVQAQWTDLLDKTVNPIVSAGTVTLTVTNPGATKNWTMMVVGH
jgi:hypothetical protein